MLKSNETMQVLEIWFGKTQNNLSLTLEGAPFQTLTHNVEEKKGNNVAYNNTHLENWIAKTPLKQSKKSNDKQDKRVATFITKS